MKLGIKFDGKVTANDCSAVCRQKRNCTHYHDLLKVPLFVDTVYDQIVVWAVLKDLEIF